MRKICSRARNSVKVKEFAEKQRNKTSRGRADVDRWRLRGGKCSGERQNTVLLLKLSPLQPHNQCCLQFVEDSRAAHLHGVLSAEHNLHKLLPQ